MSITQAPLAAKWKTPWELTSSPGQHWDSRWFFPIFSSGKSFGAHTQASLCWQPAGVPWLWRTRDVAPSETSASGPVSSNSSLFLGKSRSLSRVVSCTMKGTSARSWEAQLHFSGVCLGMLWSDDALEMLLQGARHALPFCSFFSRRVRQYLSFACLPTTENFISWIRPPHLVH